MKTIAASLFAVVVSSVALAAPIEFRGVVEGYYGRPWGTEGRLSLLDYMGENGMNVFIYGPKDDPYHHGKWRELYPEKEMSDFKKLLASAKKNKINFYWAIHLGGSFNPGNEQDYAALFRKLDDMYANGFRSFAVFFDDFGGADAAAHAEICNRVIAEFLDKKGDCSPLIVCPHVYWGGGDQYQNTLGEKLDQKAKIMWTGSWICSDIRAADVERITKAFRRPPFVWWNWPVNDYCRKHVLLGRTYGIENAPLAGFVTNPMENCEASKLAIYGVAKWCRDPARFDSQKTWEESFAKIYPDPEVAAAMRVFAEHNSDQGPNGHGYRREESFRCEALANRAREELKAGALAEGTKAELRALFKQVGGAADKLRKRLPVDKGLGWELLGWLENECYLMAQGLAALDADDKSLVRRLSRYREESLVSGEAAKERFRVATFAGDRGHLHAPEASARVLKPLVEELTKARLMALYERRFKHPLQLSGGFTAFATAKSMAKLTVTRDGKFAKIDPILELRKVAPGETFGIAVPESWETDYFHAKLGEPAAAQAGVIEVSKDGQTWQKLNVHVHGAEMETKLDVKDGWRQARYRNASDRDVTVKLNQFKFDVRGDFSPIDEMLRQLAY